MNDIIINDDLMQQYHKSISYMASKFPYRMRQDLIQEGYYGLLCAIKNFNPNKNVKLITYAIYYIKDYMLRYYKKNLRTFTEYNDIYGAGEVDFVTDIYEEQTNAKINKALHTLDSREFDIIKNRYLLEDPITLHKLGKKHSISEERTRQIEVNSLLKLRRIINE